MGDLIPPNATTIRSTASQRTFSITKATLNEPGPNQTIPDLSASVSDRNVHSWGIFFTVLGTVLLDFDADACQSPARAYLLDVTIVGTYRSQMTHIK